MKWKLWVDYFQMLSPHPSAVQRCIFCSPIKLIQFPRRNIGGNLTKSGFCPSLTANRFPGQFEFSNLATIAWVVLHLPPGHLPPPFLWHLPPLFLWHLPPPTFVHLPPGQLPPLIFFLIFHLFKRFKMTNFSLEVVMDEVLDM